MEKLNRKQRRQLPERPTAERLRNLQTIKLLNRLNNYHEMEDIINECKTIKQIKTRLQERIDATQNYINELNKDQ